MQCEKYLIDFLNVENYQAINEQAELFNAERLKEYCNWFYRRHASFIVTADLQQLHVSKKMADYSSASQPPPFY
jgi:hypothetical protein